VSAKKPPRKSAAKSAGVAKIPQPHGGALNAGGVPGNRGGGRPTSDLRERLRGSFAERVKVLESVADGEALVQVKDAAGKITEMLTSASVPDRLKALDLMARYGLGVKDETTVRVVDPEVRARVRWMFDVVRSNETWERRALLEALMPVWSTTSTVPAHYLTAESK
jgi:hypothetical protein